MNKFINGIQRLDNVTTNEKGGKAYKSTLQPLLDLFGKIGVPNPDIIHYWEAAKATNKLKAYQILLWSRDILNGAGLRANYINILNHESNTSLVDLVLLSITKGIGYWKDILKLNFGADKFFNHWIKAIDSDDRLAAKWFPRKGKWFKLLTVHKSSARIARKWLVSHSHTVEQQVCAKDFDSIKYEQVPSKAMKLHAKTFQKFDGNRYGLFINKAVKGEVKVNAKALYPYEILFSKNSWDVKTALWNNLPDFIDPNISYLPIIDCSGSMTSSYRNLVAPIKVAHSLGIYCADRNKSVFEGKLLTFSRNPQWVDLKGHTLESKARLLTRYSEIANTNLSAVFKLILDTAIQYKVSQNELPNRLLVISDGQFDDMVNADHHYNTKINDTLFVAWQKKFNEAGYNLPGIVFWNVANAHSMPFTTDERGITMVSGNSPSVMKFIGNPDPVKLLEEAIAIYEPIVKEVLGGNNA